MGDLNKSLNITSSPARNSGEPVVSQLLAKLIDLEKGVRKVNMTTRPNHYPAEIPAAIARPVFVI
tara:strand:+ start:501 stop:695 length:195 start_codon:yes stop_codon:yes gene_type:complete